MTHLKEKKPDKDRRKHTRIPTEIEITVKIPDKRKEGLDGFQQGETENLSLSGVYCKVNNFIPPLSRVEGLLVLPDVKKKSNNIHFIGVVVRSEPKKEIKGLSDYNIAIFFQDMLDSEQKKIQKYIGSVHQNKITAITSN